MSNKITITYKTRQGDLLTIAQTVIDQMENNPDFPNPPAALAELKKVLPEFQTALANAQSRDKKMVSLKNDKKKMLLALLQELAEFVTVISKGDRTMALGSGFDISGEARSKQLPAIGKLEVLLGGSGEATTRCREMTGAKAYTHQYTIEPPNTHTAWIGTGSSLASYTFKGLTSDKRYWFRVIAVGTNGEVGFSPIVSKVIQ